MGKYNITPITNQPVTIFCDHSIDHSKGASSASRQHRILCVDDEKVGTQLRADIFKECGYSVAIFHSPLAALGCDFSTFSLAIIDFCMPELNGLELLSRMRALGASFPIVLLTGSSEMLSPEDRMLFTQCIDKSRPIDHLLETISELLTFPSDSKP
jgi:CheY-like chemotaxis protein